MHIYIYIVGIPGNAHARRIVWTCTRLFQGLKGESCKINSVRGVISAKWSKSPFTTR